jgi:hypothetical protein
VRSARRLYNATLVIFGVVLDEIQMKSSLLEVRVISQVKRKVRRPMKISSVM